jgi:hypothetical protein
MSKATILKDLGQGQYQVQLVYATARIQQRLTSLQTEESKLTTAQAGQQQLVDNATSDLRLTSNLLTNAFQSGDPDQITQAEDAWLKALKALELAKDALLRTKTKLFSNRKKQEYLTANTPDSAAATVNVWCADYTEGLTGDIGIIDLPSGSIIRPGWSNTAIPASVYDTLLDGQMEPSANFASGAGRYRVMALYDAWELYTPTYRTGNITAITGDTCDLVLDVQKTRYLGIDANRETGDILQGVPIHYMDCDGAVFSVGDHVVVGFLNQSPTSAQVIGFVSDPIPCRLHGAYALYKVPPQRGAEYYYFRNSSGAGWIGRKFTQTPGAGNLDWKGPVDANGVYSQYLVMQGHRYFPSIFGTSIWQYGKVIATTPRKCMGAAIANDGTDDYIVAVTLDADDPWQATADVFIKRLLSDPNASWQTIGTMPHSAYGLDATYHHLFPSPESFAYLFSASGLKAVKLQRAVKVLDTSSVYTNNPEWETKVPQYSSLPYDSSTGSPGFQNVPIDIWDGSYTNARSNWIPNTDRPLQRSAYIVEVEISSTLNQINVYTVDQVTGAGMTANQQNLPFRVNPAGDCSDPNNVIDASNAVSGTSRLMVDYIGETKTYLDMVVDYQESVTYSNITCGAGTQMAVYQDWTSNHVISKSIDFRQDGVSLFACMRDLSEINVGSQSVVFSANKNDESIDHDLLEIDLRISSAITRKLHLVENRVGSLPHEPYADQTTTQTIDWSESVEYCSIQGGQTLGVETRNYSNTTSGGNYDAISYNHWELFSIHGIMGTVDFSDDWTEYPGITGIGWGRYGMRMIDGGGCLISDQTGGLFAGGSVSSIGLDQITGEYNSTDSSPYYDYLPKVGWPAGEQDFSLTNAIYLNRGLFIGGAWATPPGSAAENLAEITSGYKFSGALFV